MIKLNNILQENRKKSSVDEVKSVSKETLYDNEWLSLMKVKLPHSTDGYVYSHESRCDGKIIAVLLYQRTGKDGWKYGVRYEVTPAWGEDPQYSALTGGVEKNQTPEECAIMEIKEESGYIVEQKDLESLGTCFGTKSTDTTFYLYAVDVDGKKMGEKTGDGSYYDNNGEIKWMDYDPNKIKCPILSTLILRRGL